MAGGGLGRKYWRLIVVVGLVVAADQITKMMILDSVPLYSRIVVIPGFFNITHIQNPGGAFGFLPGSVHSCAKSCLWRLRSWPSA